MSFDHKAFAFDWTAFEKELLPILRGALAREDPTELVGYIKANQLSLSDPNEGDPLPQDWEAELESRDVDEYGDYALTRFYDPRADHRLGERWTALQESLPPEAQRALLGESIDEGGDHFDPGKMGTYFQDPEQVRRSLATLEAYGGEGLSKFKELLSHCVLEGVGLYVTF